ncbi:Ig-like domain-containing protein [Myxococcus sp. AM010]|uniref:Ig-like domain-containing protein n=1 Tax=Myxococcus sp. AM010 TaxID=2745138 RepID=UPI0015953DC4|nr:Ig-like domain-containing protein [Myxococcus sp. AM010]NVJ19423.1 Ig-like domain-containing protein [Myxococcus sp. AM010]
MRIVSKAVRGLSALVGAAALASIGCGDVPDASESPQTELQQTSAPLDCLSSIKPERELLIQDAAVVNDPARTAWSGALPQGRGVADGAWSFGRRMAELSGEVAPSEFIHDSLQRGAEQDAGTRARVAQLLEAWPKLADGTLDLTKAPLRLKAILNHAGSRNADRRSAGEGHLVFEAIDADGTPLNLSVTLVYDLPAPKPSDALHWARQWHDLATQAPGTKAFNTTLQAVTDRFTAAPGRVQVGTTDPRLDSGRSNSIEARRLAKDFGSLLCTDSAAPTVTLLSPAPGSALRGTVTLTASAYDDLGVTRVDFFSGSTLIASDTQPPFIVDWNTATSPPGTRVLTAQAFDADDNMGVSDPVSVMVDNSPPVIISGPPQYNQHSLSYVRGNITVGWSVTDQGLSGVALAEFFQEGYLKGSLTGHSGLGYNFSWDTRVLANRSYSLILRATDNAGNVATHTRSLIVDNAAPTSVLLAPLNGAVVSGVVTLAANASDSQLLHYVVFEIDGVLQYPYSTTAPFTRAWDTTGKSGTHVIVAIAYDRAGNSRRSNAVTVTVP